MKYMLLIYHAEQAWGLLSEQDRQKIYAEYGKFTQEIIASGHISRAPSAPLSTATSVRVRDVTAFRRRTPPETKSISVVYLIEARDSRRGYSNSRAHPLGADGHN